MWGVTHPEGPTPRIQGKVKRLPSPSGASHTWLAALQNGHFEDAVVPGDAPLRGRPPPLPEVRNHALWHHADEPAPGVTPSPHRIHVKAAGCPPPFFKLKRKIGWLPKVGFQWMTPPANKISTLFEATASFPYAILHTHTYLLKNSKRFARPKFGLTFQSGIAPTLIRGKTAKENLFPGQCSFQAPTVYPHFEPLIVCPAAGHWQDTN